MLTIALIQADIIWEDPDKNLIASSNMINEIGEQVDVIFLPETFTTGFSMRSTDLAEPMEGKTMSWMAEKAIGLNTDLAGSLIIRDGNKYFNRLIWMHKDGNYQYYDKRHLFSIGGEDEHYSRGQSPIIINCGGIRFKPLICYDLRFPVWARNRDDYDVLVYLANWPAPRSDVWKALLRARAIENQSYTIGVNRVGKDGLNIEYLGNSIVLDAKGQEVASMGSEEAGLIKVNLSIKEQNAFRKKFPVWKDADRFTLED